MSHQQESIASIRWFGDVPSGWSVQRLKQVTASVTSGVSVNASDVAAGEHQFGVLKTSAVSGGRFFPEENKTVWESETDRLSCPVTRDSMIISRMNTPSLVGESGYVLHDCPNLFLPDRLWKLMFDRKRVFTPYIAKVLSSSGARQALSCMATGTSPSMKNLSIEEMGNLPVPLPALDEQEIISAYLETETTRIDGLIAAKERMLALLEEKRAALISRVVTRGLDPNTPLKPSGQEWLGEIPADWQEPRAKGLFREVDRRTETGEETLLSLRMGKGLVPHNEVSEKPLEASDVTGFKKIQPGQMVINRMRAASGLIAIAAESGLVSPDYAVFDVVDQELSIEYFLELFKTSLLQAVFRSSSKGLGTGEQGFLRLYTDAFLSLHFPYPPVSEQRAIASFIEQQRSEVLQMESLLRRSIELAKERRAALITAAVTGQIPLEAMRG